MAESRRTYDTIIDFGEGLMTEDTSVEFTIYDSKVKKNSEINSYVVQDDSINERGPADHVLEQLLIKPAGVSEGSHVIMLAHAPNGTHGKYAVRTQIL